MRLAVAVALVAVAVILLSSGSTYPVKALFQNASQIVSSDLVEVAGNPIGTVSNIALTPQGEAQLTLSINNKAYDPLRHGTQAGVLGGAEPRSASGSDRKIPDHPAGDLLEPVIRRRSAAGSPAWRRVAGLSEYRRAYALAVWAEAAL